MILEELLTLMHARCVTVEKGDAVARRAQLVDQRAHVHNLLVRVHFLPLQCGMCSNMSLDCRMLWRFHAIKKQLLRAQRKDD